MDERTKERRGKMSLLHTQLNNTRSKYNERIMLIDKLLIAIDDIVTDEIYLHYNNDWLDELIDLLEKEKRASRNKISEVGQALATHNP